jgi:hypothetical protein
MPEQIAFVYTACPQGWPKIGKHGRILRLLKNSQPHTDKTEHS